MDNRRQFIKKTSFAGTALLLANVTGIGRNSTGFESRRPPLADRKFSSVNMEAAINRIKKTLPGSKIAWLFENCFPNTLDTTVEHTISNGRPDTYVITGDIDAMWLRDSTAQVWPYLPLMKGDPALQQLVAGVINRQSECIRLDPYANAFYKDPGKVSEWKKTDITDMKPGIHERKWEIDSLCYPIRLAHRYWELTGDTQPFNSDWKQTIALVVQTFKEQQRKKDRGPYSFQRTTAWATDGVPLGGYGYPVKPVGLICSMFRPSDDATIFPFLIPSNFFAMVSLRQAADLVNRIYHDAGMAATCEALARELELALAQYATVPHPKHGRVYPYEVNGFGSYNLMDDANVPSLLSLPYLNAVRADDPVYLATRRHVLSAANPFFFSGRAAEGTGGPHAGMNMIWPLGITMRALTSRHEKEIKKCLAMLVNNDAGTGFMHESFHKDDPSNFTRKWFAWANTLFGELVMKLQATHPSLLTA